MAYKIGVISQKGGVGKSTIARLLAVEYARLGWDVLIADLDTSQATSFEWNGRRIKNEVEPHVAVQQFPNVKMALKKNDDVYDMIIFDGAPHATKATEEIANSSDLVILPTGNSPDDLNPQIRLAHELKKRGTAFNKISFAMSRIGDSESEYNDVLDYLGATGYFILDGAIQERVGYRRAISEGKALSETQYKSLNSKAEMFVQSVVDRFDSIK